jgi:hypothetical protein
LSKSPKDSSGGKEHTSNARPSTKAKHEAGQAAKKKSRGGEAGDSNRDYPRRRPINWSGGWPPKKFEIIENVVIQIGLTSPTSRLAFRNELNAWAEHSKLVESWNIEFGNEGPNYFWNLHFQTSNLKESWRSLRYLVAYFERQYRAQCRRMGAVLSDPEACPPAIIVATRNQSWDDYILLHHTDPENLEDEDI